MDENALFRHFQTWARQRFGRGSQANVMMFESCSSGDTEAAAERMADWFSAGQIDQLVRQAVHYCWMALPKERRSTQELENQIHRLVERALKDFREDREAFGHGTRA